MAKLFQRPEQVTVMGVDPGFAKGGLAVLRSYPEGRIEPLAVKVLKTKKTPKKDRSNLRVTNDDVRRYREIWAELDMVSQQHDVVAVGVEGYRAFGQVSGSATKTLAVYGGILYWAWSRDLFVTPFLPTDLKKEFGATMSASKEEVRAGVSARVDGLAELFAAVPRAQREHVGDAAGHALLVLSEIENTWAALGMGAER